MYSLQTLKLCSIKSGYQRQMQSCYGFFGGPMEMLGPTFQVFHLTFKLTAMAHFSEDKPLPCFLQGRGLFCFSPNPPSDSPDWSVRLASTKTNPTVFLLSFFFSPEKLQVAWSYRVTALPFPSEPKRPPPTRHKGLSRIKQAFP